MTHLVDELWQHTVVDRESSNAKSCCYRRMGVDNRCYVLTGSQNAQVHIQFTGWQSVTLQELSG